MKIILELNDDVSLDEANLMVEYFINENEYVADAYIEKGCSKNCNKNNNKCNNNLNKETNEQ